MKYRLTGVLQYELLNKWFSFDTCLTIKDNLAWPTGTDITAITRTLHNMSSFFMKENI